MDHPPPNLLGLPAELKARIVEMVHGQEEAWQERQRHQGDEDEVNHINCLAALSLVNKEIHGMACRHIFEVVRASRSQDPMFANAILLRRRNHISHVNFDYVSVVDNTFLALFPGVRTLALRDISLRETADGEKTSVGPLSDAIAGLRGLEVLNRDCWQYWDGLPAARRSSDIPLLGTPAPPLKYLHLSSVYHSQADLDFLSLVGPTLEALYLDVSELHPPLRSSPSSSPANHTRTILRLPPGYAGLGLHPIPLPRLSPRFFDVPRPPADFTTNAGPLTILRNQLPTLLHVEFIPYLPLRAGHVRLINEFCATRLGLVLQRDSAFEAYGILALTDTGGASGDPPKVGVEEMEWLCEELDGVLEFGKNEVARMRREGDFEKGVRLAKMLRPLDKEGEKWAL